MDCTQCPWENKCRKELERCTAVRPDAEALVAQYHEPLHQEVIQAAAQLVDGGRAGQLSRIQEVIEFCQLQKYPKVGLAYCFGQEQEARLVVELMRRGGVQVSAVSCAAGGQAQDELNERSTTHKIACNPFTQAAQLNAEQVPIAFTMGLCLGHDILFGREFAGDVSALVVKDRTNGHNPLQAIRDLAAQQPSAIAPTGSPTSSPAS